MTDRCENGEHINGRPEREAGKYSSAFDAAIALYRNEIDEDAFIEAVVAFPIVQQNPMPESIRLGLDDYWALKDGPIGQVARAFTARLISGSTYDRAINAMAQRGHSA